jgi:hypothetical protein
VLTIHLQLADYKKLVWMLAATNYFERRNCALRKVPVQIDPFWFERAEITENGRPVFAGRDRNLFPTAGQTQGSCHLASAPMLSVAFQIWIPPNIPQKGL